MWCSFTRRRRTNKRRTIHNIQQREQCVCVCGLQIRGASVCAVGSTGSDAWERRQKRGHPKPLLCGRPPGKDQSAYGGEQEEDTGNVRETWQGGSQTTSRTNVPHPPPGGVPCRFGTSESEYERAREGHKTRQQRRKEAANQG